MVRLWKPGVHMVLAILIGSFVLAAGGRSAAAPDAGSWETVAAPPGFNVPGVEWIKIHGINGRSFTAAVARPAGTGPFPLIVILHGGSGVRPEHAELAARLSREGFMVVAGCWIVPVQPNPATCGEATSRADVVTNPSLAGQELIAAARSLPGAGSRFALFGTSLGGWAAMWAATLGPAPDAIVLDAAAHSCPCPGAPPYPPSRRTSEVLSSLRTPVLMFQATGDPTVPVDAARQYEAAAREAGKPLTAVYYEGIRHPAVLAPVVGTGDPVSRADAEGRIVAFLRAALMTPVSIEGTAVGTELVPPVSAAAGARVSITFNDQTRDLGYTITLNGLSAAQLSSATLNLGARGANGPVVHNLSLSESLASSGWVRLSAAEAADLRAGNLYIAMSSREAPGGFARIQLSTGTGAAGLIAPPSTGDAGLTNGFRRGR